MLSENFTNLSLKLLKENHLIKPFDCEDVDLNEFLFEKAILYKKEYLATTFIIENNERTVAYYSVLNDSLQVEDEYFETKSSFKRFLKKLLSHPKRHLRSFPALKIGRLAIDKSFKGKGLGTTIVNKLIYDGLELNSSHACKLITVDAYAESLNFYEKLGFQYLTDSDQGQETRQMYFDLSVLNEKR